MEEGTTEQTATDGGPADPIAVTREHLDAIGEVWLSFAKKKIERYEGKLPESLQRLVRPPTAEATDGEAAEGGAG